MYFVPRYQEHCDNDLLIKLESIVAICATESKNLIDLELSNGSTAELIFQSQEEFEKEYNRVRDLLCGIGPIYW